MTGSRPDTRDQPTRPISVAELLAKNGTIGSPPVTGRRRRRRGNSDAVTVAELTGEIPVVQVDDESDRDGSPPPAAGPVAEPVPEPVPEPVEEPHPVSTLPALDDVRQVGWSEPGPRWPKSLAQPRNGPGPEHGHDPRPARRPGPSPVQRDQPAGHPAAQLSLDLEPAADDSDIEVDEFDIAMRDAGLPTEDAVDVDSHPGEEHPWPSEVLGGAAIVLQSILAVAFGAGLFIAFDQLWRWNNIVALLLTVLVTVGLVVAVQVVRKTADVGSTLTAVAVGLLVTLGPLALHAT